MVYHVLACGTSIGKPLIQDPGWRVSHVEGVDWSGPAGNPG